MNLLVEYGDLFEISNEINHNGWVLGHCVSADFELAAGIALEFNKRYDMRRKLKEKYEVNGQVPNCLKIENVYNLVTKDKYYNKPTYTTLGKSLLMVRDQMIANGETKLGLPEIGCGLDKLQWVYVEQILREVFKNTEIDIRVRILKK